jgi:hypothetical protein
VRSRWLTALVFWVLRHLVVILLIGFVAWGVWWREALLPQWFGEPAVRRAADRAVPPPVGESAGGFRPVTEQVGPATDLGPCDDLAAGLQMARRAYWNDDPAGAEARYRELMGRYPQAPGAYGELGNLLLAQGREAEARALFEQAAVLLEADARGTAAAELRRYLAVGASAAP